MFTVYAVPGSSDVNEIESPVTTCARVSQYPKTVVEGTTDHLINSEVLKCESLWKQTEFS